MIRIERSDVKKPAGLDKATAPALSGLRDFFGQKASVKGQRTARFEIPHIDFVKRPLLELFHFKCAYCETRITADSGHVDPFRPKQNALARNGRPSREHYWWLLYEWENNLPSCFTCNRQKGSSFPLQSGSRAKPETKAPELDQVEKRLLLDPCNDQPEQSLSFSLDGTVRGEDARGTATIETLGLNRSGLVKARANALDLVGQVLETLDLFAQEPREVWTKKQQADEAQLRAKLLAEIADESEYAAAKRQLVEPALRLGAGDRPTSERAKQRLSEPGGTKKGDAWEYGSIWIERIEIENFKAIESLDLRFAEPEANYESELSTLFHDLGRIQDREGNSGEPWMMLLGENGIGKSSILKAVTLPFMDPEQALELIGPPERVVNRKARSGKGSVKLHFNRSDTPLTVTFAKGERGYSWNYVPPPIPIIAYGATRLPPLPGEETGPRQLLEVSNLFDPRAGLSDPERYFADADRVDSERFNAFARALRLLLNLEDEVQISRRKGELRIKIHPERAPIPLRDSSDGYRSIAALATDIMEKLSRDWLNMESAEGTVLLDELEAHLHPAWKIEIVDRLRKVFPRVRFIVTTHDPLCLHGTEKGEVIRLDHHPDTGRVRATMVDMDEGMRADQLLTGEWFGLASTLDRDTLALQSEHAALLAKTKRNPDEDQLLIRIEEQLNERLDGGYAETPTERIAIRATKEIVQERSQVAAPTMTKKDIGDRVRALTRKKKQQRK